MAYMDQAKKARIAAELKKVVPKDWKYSLSVNNNSTLSMTVRSAGTDILAGIRRFTPGASSLTVNPYYHDRSFGGDLLVRVEKILSCLNSGNWNRSDTQTDYFDVGHYVRLSFGTWDKPFICTGRQDQREMSRT